MTIRLVVKCAVVDDAGRILLSLRRESNLWDLPGGRVEAGEFLDDAAIRHAQEATGLVMGIDRAAGLYFWPGRRQVGVLFAGFPLGGTLIQRTKAAGANQFIRPNRLPDNLRWPILATDALAEARYEPRVIHATPAERRQQRRHRRWRWLKRWFQAFQPTRAGHSVPLDARAVGVIWDQAHQRVLTLRGPRTHELPRLICQGERAPWDELADMLVAVYGVRVAFRWAGAWQDVSRNAVEFVFAATTRETSETIDEMEWSLARTAALTDRDAAYVNRIRPTYARDPVWLLGKETPMQSGDTIAINPSTIYSKASRERNR